MKKSTKVILGVAAFIVVCGAIGSTNEDAEKKDGTTQIVSNESNDNASQSNKVDKDQQKDESSDKSNKEEDAKPTEQPKEVSNVFSVGDVVETKSVNIAYLGCGVYEEPNEFLQPKDGYQYIYFELEFENVGKSDYYISSLDCYADGYNCDANYFVDDTSIGTTISSGRKTKVKMYFTVPVDAQEIEAEYETNLWTSNKIIFNYE